MRLFTQVTVKANVVKDGENLKWKKLKSSKIGPKGSIRKKKFSGRCFNCDRVGHEASDYKKPKKNQEANLNEGPNIDFYVMVSKVSLGGSNSQQCQIDNGATRHVFHNKEFLHNFNAVKDEEKLFMKNLATSKMKD